MWRHWALITWRLVVSCSIISVAGVIIGCVATTIFQQKLPQVKTVGIVTSLQNTLLARVILQTSFPVADASLMVVTITCLEVMSQAVMILLYISHTGIWLYWPSYRSRHDSIGISSAHHSVGERIVKSMIKAGEITMSRASSSDSTSSQPQSDKSTTPTVTSKLGQIPILVPGSGRDGYTFGTIGLRKSDFSFSLGTICKRQHSLGSTFNNSSTGELSLRYFASSSPHSQPRSENDSLSIDYAMLHANTQSKEKVRENSPNIEYNLNKKGQQEKDEKHTKNSEKDNGQVFMTSDHNGTPLPHRNHSSEEGTVMNSLSEKSDHVGLL